MLYGESKLKIIYTLHIIYKIDTYYIQFTYYIFLSFLNVLLLSLLYAICKHTHVNNILANLQFATSKLPANISDNSAKII